MPRARRDSRKLGDRENEGDAIGEQLNRIMSSRAFRGSARHRRFLSYVVDRAIAGEADDLKGYTIGIDVFDRPAEFDSQVDPIVRIEAGRLRRSLEQYYLTEGKHDPILITIPKGGYSPQFSPHAAVSADIPTPLPDKIIEPPTVMVLPFRNLGIRVDDGPADAFAEEISVNLARFRHLSVIPSAILHPTTLAAQFTLGGSIQVLEGKVSARVWLVEAKTGKIVWSDVFETAKSKQQSGAALPEIAGFIAAEVGHPLGSLARFVAMSEERCYSSYNALREAHRYGQTRDGTQLPRILALLEAAIGDDPRNSEALALLSMFELDRPLGGTVVWETDRTVIRRALDHAKRAVDIDPCNATAHQALFKSYFRLGRAEQALNAGLKEVRLNPNHSTLLAAFGAELCYCGEWDEGRKHLRESRRIIQDVPYWFRIVDVFDHYGKREYQRALRVAEDMDSRCVVPPTLRAMLYGKLRMTRKGRQELEELSEVAPDLSREVIESVFVVRRFDKAAISEFMKHLESVGLNDVFA